MRGSPGGTRYYTCALSHKPLLPCFLFLGFCSDWNCAGSKGRSCELRMFGIQTGAVSLTHVSWERTMGSGQDPWKTLQAHSRRAAFGVPSLTLTRAHHRPWVVWQAASCCRLPPQERTGPFLPPFLGPFLPSASPQPIIAVISSLSGLL